MTLLFYQTSLYLFRLLFRNIQNAFIILPTVDCPLGTFSDSGTCKLCSIGTYQDESGQSSCKPCSIGFTTKYKGSQNITDCIGMYVIKDELNLFHHSKFMCFREPLATSKVVFDYRPTQLLRYDLKFNVLKLTFYFISYCFINDTGSDNTVS